MPRDETITCAACGGDRFPEGIGVVECETCGARTHPGCSGRHEADHEARGEDRTRWRRGTMGGYGIIRWEGN